MRDYETAFIDRMNRQIEEGMNFADVVQETVAETMGETPSQVLFKMIGKPGVMQPPIFVERVSRFFEDGARDILAAIESRALRWRDLGAYEEPSSAFESIMGTLVLVQEVQTRSSATVLLHNHRIKDQLGTYAEDE